MKLLFITRKIDENDFLAGFTLTWLRSFSEHFEKINVICLEKGNYKLPLNISVYSMGKENNLSKLKILFNLIKLCFLNIPKNDIIFVHMIPLYACIAGPISKLFNKKMFLWFTHKAIPFPLKFAEVFCKKILTASNESCNLNSKKLTVFGHGIDNKRFKYLNLNRKPFTIIYVGRISKIKRFEIAIKAINILKTDIPEIKLNIVGGIPENSNNNYLNKLRKLITDLKLKNNIEFIGAIENNKLPEIYNKNEIILNLCPTGGMDKTVLEGAMCKCFPIVFNKTFSKLFGKYSSNCLCENESYENLAENIKNYYTMDKTKKNKIINIIHKRTLKKYSLNKFSVNLKKLFKKYEI